MIFSLSLYHKLSERPLSFARVIQQNDWITTDHIGHIPRVGAITQIILKKARGEKESQELAIPRETKSYVTI
jgi:hypothetical protein